MKILLLGLLLPVKLFSQNTVGIEQYIDSLMAPLNNRDMPASLLIIAKDGKPIVRKAYGMASLELNAPASPEQLFTLASVNKQMVAICILQLASQGQLKLTDDIKKHLPAFDIPGDTITVEQLLNHTSGLFSGNSAVRGKTFYEHVATEGILSDKEFMDYVKRAPLSFKPGTDWTWNTWAFHIAFFIVEKVSGMPFNEYVRKYLFEPAGMSKSFSKVDGNRLGLYGIPNLISTFYYRDFDGKWVWRDTRSLLPYFFYQRYSIVTCLDDLVKWDAALRGGKLLPLEWLKLAWQKGRLKDGRSINYGLGWVVSDFAGYRLLTHIGIGTNPICVVHVPQERLYIAYTQFFGSYEQVEIKVKGILSRLLEVPYRSSSPATAPLADYTGVYEVHRNGLDIASSISELPVHLHVTVANDTLYIRQTAGEKIPLRADGKDRFLAAPSENISYIFSRDENGKVVGITTKGTFWSYGPDVVNKRENKSFPQPVSPVTISMTQLTKYAGIYHLSTVDSYIMIEAEGGKLYNRVQGRRQELITLTKSKFVRKDAQDIIFEFNEDATELIYSGLRKLKYKKIN